MFTRELQDITLTEANVTATFECEISKDGLKLEWYCDGKKISRSENYDISSEGKLHKLVIEKAITDSAGKYSAKYKDAETTATLAIEGKNFFLYKIINWLSHDMCVCVVTLLVLYFIIIHVYSHKTQHFN